MTAHLGTCRAHEGKYIQVLNCQRQLIRSVLLLLGYTIDPDSICSKVLLYSSVDSSRFESIKIYNYLVENRLKVLDPTGC